MRKHLLVLMLIFLTGCASSIKNHSDEIKALNLDQDGLVVGRMALVSEGFNETHGGTYLFDDFRGLFKRVDDKTDYKFQSKSGDYFAFILPPGTYSNTALNVQSLKHYLKLPTLDQTFEVKQGEVTYLGEMTFRAYFPKSLVKTVGNDIKLLLRSFINSGGMISVDRSVVENAASMKTFLNNAFVAKPYTSYLASDLKAQKQSIKQINLFTYQDTKL